MKEFIKKFTNETIVKEEQVFQIRSDYYLVVPELIQTLRQTQHRAVGIGIFLGKNKKFFHPSLFLLKKLAESSGKAVKVNEKGEWMFICGKNIHKENILEKCETLEKGDFALIKNRNDECIGYARFAGDFNQKVPLENIFDIGDFLRRERKK